MKGFIAGIVITGVLFGAPLAFGAAEAQLGGDEARHGRMEEEICARPRHFYRWHGIEIMPESCDR